MFLKNYNYDQPLKQPNFNKGIEEIYGDALNLMKITD